MKNKYKKLPEEVRAIIEILLIGTISVTLVYFGILK
jgi:hypothetical protein